MSEGGRLKEGMTDVRIEPGYFRINFRWRGNDIVNIIITGF